MPSAPVLGNIEPGNDRAPCPELHTHSSYVLEFVLGDQETNRVRLPHLFFNRAQNFAAARCQWPVGGALNNSCEIRQRPSASLRHTMEKRTTVVLPAAGGRPLTHDPVP